MRRLEERIAALDKSAEEFLQIADAYPRELTHTKPSEAAFSATEVVYHILDVERLWQRRIHGVRNGTITTFQQMNPDQEARNGGYNEKNYDNGISEWKNARRETITLIQSMEPQELLLVGTHSTYGEMDTYAILAKIEEHDRTHAAQLDRTLRQVGPRWPFRLMMPLDPFNF